MNEAAESVKAVDPNEATSNDAADNPKRSKKRSALPELDDAMKNLLKDLKEAGAPSEVIASIKTVGKIVSLAQMTNVKLKGEIANERKLRNEAECEAQENRVKANLLEIELNELKAEIGTPEDRKYKEVEGAGEW